MAEGRVASAAFEALLPQAGVNRVRQPPQNPRGLSPLPLPSFGSPLHFMSLPVLNVLQCIEAEGKPPEH